MGGEGTSIVGDKVLEWNKHDCFAVPNWAWHEHINRSKSEAAILFSVNDIPIVEAFNLYREEPENSLHTTQAPQVPSGRKITAVPAVPIVQIDQAPSFILPRVAGEERGGD